MTINWQTVFSGSLLAALMLGRCSTPGSAEEQPEAPAVIEISSDEDSDPPRRRTFRPVLATVEEERTIVVRRPVIERTHRQETVTVRRPIREVVEEEESYTVRRPVVETVLRDEAYTVRRPVIETSEREEVVTVRRPVVETAQRQERVVVRRPVTEVIQREEQQVVYEQQLVCVPQYAGNGQWIETPQAQTVQRIITRRVPVQSTRFVDQEEIRTVPVETVRYVEEQQVQRRPIRTKRYVEEQRTRKVPVTTTRYVEEQRVRKVPVERVRYVEEEVVRNVPVETETIVEEKVVRRVPVKRYLYEEVLEDESLEENPAEASRGTDDTQTYYEEPAEATEQPRLDEDETVPAPPEDRDAKAGQTLFQPRTRMVRVIRPRD